MPVERSAGAIIFRREPFDVAQGKEGNIYYLLLHYPSSATRAVAKGKEEDLPSSPKAKKPRSRVNSLRGRDYWDFPKGHIEEGEDELKTVQREIFEETGLDDLGFIEGFQETIQYFFKFQGQTIFKTVAFYLAETKNKTIKLSFEHIGSKWLPFEEALELLTFKNAKENLKKANDFISGKNIQSR